MDRELRLHDAQVRPKRVVQCDRTVVEGYR